MSKIPSHLRPFGTKWHSPVRDVLSPLTHPPAHVPERRNPQAQSLGTFGAGGSAKPTPRYTGSAVVGIATMHKSNAVPAFSKVEAEELARMRR